VKGPNDRLSDKQIAWLETMMTAGVDCEVISMREQCFSFFKFVFFIVSKVCLVRVKRKNQS